MVDADGTPATGRTTAPQSDFGFDQVKIGLLIFIVGMLIAFGIPAITL